MSQLILKGVRKSFGKTVAVHDFDLEVAQGEFVALLGPSGCGKTTTLRVVAGFERPDAGEVRIRGESATDKPPYRRDIGIVFQSYALFPHMTVLDNVAYGLRMRKVPRGECRERVRTALQLVHLERLDDRYPRQLSGGQQQRVAVARAVVIRPSVLLFDEPLSNLDARLRQEMRRELRQLQRSLRIATIFVTHDQEEALSMADRVVVMNAGRIEQVGTPEEIYARPASPFVLAFIGECNILPGTISAVEGERGVFAAASGAKLRLPPGPAVRPGTPGTLAIRPEDLLLLTAEQVTPPGCNELTGTVTTVTYLGSVCHYQIRAESGDSLLVYEQGGRGRRVAEGISVRVAWRAELATFRPEAAGEGGA
jgi:putative spermidine/putrescine transport system ATP-binding protein